MQGFSYEFNSTSDINLNVNYSEIGSATSSIYYFDVVHLDDLGFDTVP